jgi:hypothetical protein
LKLPITIDFPFFGLILKELIPGLTVTLWLKFYTYSVSGINSAITSLSMSISPAEFFKDFASRAA